MSLLGGIVFLLFNLLLLEFENIIFTIVLSCSMTETAVIKFFELEHLNHFICRIIEVKGHDTTTSSTRDTRELLQKHFNSQEGLRVVVTCPFIDEDDLDGGASSAEMYKKLSSSLNVRLESQNAEVEHWRHECNR